MCARAFFAKKRARIFLPCVRVCVHGSLRKAVYNSFKFHKDTSIHCGDIFKTILTFESHQFSMYFPYFHSYSLQRLIITERSWNFLETSYQNVHM